MADYMIKGFRYIAYSLTQLYASLPDITSLGVAVFPRDAGVCTDVRVEVEMRMRTSIVHMSVLIACTASSIYLSMPCLCGPKHKRTLSMNLP
jgi:hypothetical protein